MNSCDSEMLALAAEQFGMVSRRQLLIIGMSPEMIRTRLKQGRLVEAFPRAYRAAGSPESWHSKLLAADVAREHRCRVA